MAEPSVQVPVSLIERIHETTQALQKMPILSAGSGTPDVRFNLNVVTEHFNAVHAAVADVTALLAQPTPTVEPCERCGGTGYQGDGPSTLGVPCPNCKPAAPAAPKFNPRVTLTQTIVPAPPTPPGAAQ